MMPRSSPKVGRSLVALAWLLVCAAPLLADPTEPRVPAGKVVSGTLFSQEPGGRSWEQSGAVFTRDHLLVLGGLQAIVEPAPETIKLKLWGNLPDLSPYAVLESSVILHDTKHYDLDFTLVSGRIVLTNTRKSGSAKVWLRLPTDGWELTLDQPGAEVALELYGRWARGVPFSRNPLASQQPTSVLTVLAISGRCDVKFGGLQQPLQAPPGPALWRWDSVGGADASPQRIEKLPEWTDPQATPTDDAKALHEIVGEYVKLLHDRAPVDALIELQSTASKNGDKDRAALTHQFTIIGLAALGALDRLADALADPQAADMRSTAILALRHWIGAAPGRDQQLYRLFVEAFRFPERQAETVLQMLHSPFDGEDPTTFQTLIAYLQHEKLAIRELARWHLYRLVPEGKAIPYDAAGGPDARATAAKAWKELIPEGQLPKKPK